MDASTHLTDSQAKRTRRTFVRAAAVLAGLYGFSITRSAGPIVASASADDGAGVRDVLSSGNSTFDGMVAAARERIKALLG